MVETLTLLWFLRPAAALMLSPAAGIAKRSAVAGDRVILTTAGPANRALYRSPTRNNSRPCDVIQ